jgi:hypothetical protein
MSMGMVRFGATDEKEGALAFLTSYGRTIQKARRFSTEACGAMFFLISIFLFSYP